MPARLRIYHGPQEDVATPHLHTAARKHEVNVSLGEVLPLLVDAVQSQRTWLGDFVDDKVTISMDLYEVLLAYQHYRRPSA
jgi:hypothetical protein